MKTKLIFIAVIAMLLAAGTLKAQEQADINTDSSLKALSDSTSSDNKRGIAVHTEVAANPDTVIVNTKDNRRVIVIERDDRGRTKEVIYYKNGQKKRWPTRWSVLFDIGFNSYSSKNALTGSKDNTGIGYPDLNTSKSVNVAIYPVFRSFKLTKNNLLSMQTGLGFDWGNYRFEDGWTIEKVGSIVVPSNRYRPNGDNLLSKSKLTTVYLNVPLLLNLNIPIGGSSRNQFHLSAGIIGGVKIGSHTKIKYADGGKEKDRSSFSLNLLRYDLTLRAGYKWVNLFVNYQMTPMFEDGKAHKLFPYSVGLSFLLSD